MLGFLSKKTDFLGGLFTVLSELQGREQVRLLLELQAAHHVTVLASGEVAPQKLQHLVMLLFMRLTKWQMSFILRVRFYNLGLKRARCSRKQVRGWGMPTHIGTLTLWLLGGHGPSRSTMCQPQLAGSSQLRLARALWHVVSWSGKEAVPPCCGCMRCQGGGDTAAEGVGSRHRLAVRVAGFCQPLEPSFRLLPPVSQGHRLSAWGSVL